MPERLQLSRRKGWRKPPGAVVVARGTRWGNPFKVEDHGRAEAVRCYREQVEGSRVLQDDIRKHLAGKDLACWCPVFDEHGARVPCHADVLLEYANQKTGE